MPFDPSKPFEVESQPAVAFDPSLPFEVEAATAAAPAPVRGASPTAQQEAFRQQFIQANTQTPAQQVLGALTAGPRAGINMAKGLGGILLEGAKDVGNIYREAINQPTIADTIKNFNANVAQTAGEVLPRMAYELGQGGVAGFQSPETATQTLRGLTAISNPIVGAIQAALNPQAAPTQERAQQAFEESLVNEALAKQGETGILETAQRAADGSPIGKTSIGAARAAPIVSPFAPAALGRISSLAGRVATAAPRALARISPTAETAAMSALKLGKEEVQAILPSAVPNITKAAGKALPNVEEIIQAAPKARKALFDEAIDGLTKAKEEGLVAKGSTAVDDAIEAIKSDSRYMTDKADEAAALIEKYEKYRRELDPLEAQKLLEDTNSGLSSHWDKSAKGQKLDLTDAELRAERALAANLSRQVDDLYQIGSRTFNDPYRQIGKIIELEKNLKITKDAAERAFAERVSPSRRKGGSVPVGKVETARKVGGGITSAFRNTELELLNKNLNNAFKGAPKPLKSVPVPEESIPSLSRSYLRGETPPPLPVEAAPVVAPTLEEVIRQLKRSDPAKFRNDPTLAKITAEALLRSQASP